ncbi:hypothetical protein SGRA_1243 [Saprospira grandis str. Lewin]|uniref:Uncharacterized protein n=1 Tax=Saprospira grandis (strain Lewin) TaxID=984262 RepID=H6L4Q4_SAPGL|nr:hypothetical protein SGRA_1243 [Saprospira grandis str. Lewin]
MLISAQDPKPQKQAPNLTKLQQDNKYLLQPFYLGPPQQAAALRFGARRSARPCGGCAALVWPDGHPAASLGRLALRAMAAASPAHKKNKPHKSRACL